MALPLRCPYNTLWLHAASNGCTWPSTDVNIPEPEPEPVRVSWPQQAGDRGHPVGSGALPAISPGALRAASHPVVHTWPLADVKWRGAAVPTYCRSSLA
jgi:hypothetical protein